MRVTVGDLGERIRRLPHIRPAALLGHIRLERVAPCDSVVFVRTGGVHLIFLRDPGQQIAGEI